MSNRKVDASNNIMGRIKELLGKFKKEALNIFSIISYSDKYDTKEEEYAASSQKDSEIIKALEEADKKINDYESFVSSGRKMVRQPQTKAPKNSILAQKADAEKANDTDRIR